MSAVLSRIGSALYALVDSQRQVSYRRLLVFAVVTGLLAFGLVGEETWLWLALAYVATEGAQRIAETIRPA